MGKPRCRRKWPRLIAAAHTRSEFSSIAKLEMEIQQSMKELEGIR
jgi:hypothetical protein